MTDKIPVISYSEEVRQKVSDTCQEHVQANSEQNKIETKVEESFQKLSAFKQKFPFSKIDQQVEFSILADFRW